MSESRRSRIGSQRSQADGSEACLLHIPLGHPAAERRDQEQTLFEVEQAIRYEAGPGFAALRMIDPSTGEGIPVDENLLPTDRPEDAVLLDADRLETYLRRRRESFDRAVQVTHEEQETSGDGAAAGRLLPF